MSNGLSNSSLIQNEWKIYSYDLYMFILYNNKGCTHEMNKMNRITLKKLPISENKHFKVSFKFICLDDINYT